MTNTTPTDPSLILAGIIRQVDGKHTLGAEALAEAILAHPGSCWGPAQSAPSLPYSVPRCLGVGYVEDGVLEWREGCETCRRRTAAPHPDPSQQRWIEPPPIIAFWCEYLIEPDPF